MAGIKPARGGTIVPPFYHSGTPINMQNILIYFIRFLFGSGQLEILYNEPKTQTESIRVKKINPTRNGNPTQPV